MEKIYKAYKEVLEIFKYMSKEEVDKIPKDLILTFEENKDINHNFKVDITKNIEEQNLLEETKDILYSIYRDYWATSEEREKILAREKIELQKIETKKREKYNPDKIFENKNSIKKENKITEKYLTVVEEKKFSEKIKDFIKKIFKL